MKAIRQMEKSQIRNANKMLNKNLSREQISYYMGVKRVATDVLNFVEDLIKKEEEELEEILRELPLDIGKRPAPTGLFQRQYN